MIFSWLKNDCFHYRHPYCIHGNVAQTIYIVLTLYVHCGAMKYVTYLVIGIISRTEMLCLLTGSPWQVDILSADQVHTNAHELGMLMINQPASFEIYTDREAEASLNVNISGVWI